MPNIDQVSFNKTPIWLALGIGIAGLAYAFRKNISQGYNQYFSASSSVKTPGSHQPQLTTHTSQKLLSLAARLEAMPASHALDKIAHAVGYAREVQLLEEASQDLTNLKAGKPCATKLQWPLLQSFGDIAVDEKTGQARAVAFFADVAKHFPEVFKKFEALYQEQQKAWHEAIMQQSPRFMVDKGCCGYEIVNVEVDDDATYIIEGSFKKVVEKRLAIEAEMETEGRALCATKKLSRQWISKIKENGTLTYSVGARLITEAVLAVVPREQLQDHYNQMIQEGRLKASLCHSQVHSETPKLSLTITPP